MYQCKMSSSLLFSNWHQHNNIIAEVTFVFGRGWPRNLDYNNNYYTQKLTNFCLKDYCYHSVRKLVRLLSLVSEIILVIDLSPVRKWCSLLFHLLSHRTYLTDIYQFCTNKKQCTWYNVTISCDLNPITNTIQQSILSPSGECA